MVKRLLIAFSVLLSFPLMAQEMLVPASGAMPLWPAAKESASAVSLPIFDDFSGPAGGPSTALWDYGGAMVADGFAPHPPTVGVLLLDAYDADGTLYQQASTSLFAADTATSLPIRLDTLSPADSLVLSFFYLPGGGSGNLWERVGDAPDAHDSLYLEFFSATDSSWRTVWSRGGIGVDSLIAHTGKAWQYVAVAISDSIFFDSTFRFRFRNLCSLEDNGKAGAVVGGDQWSIDYVYIDRQRSVVQEPVFRDVAFVDPAPSLLAEYYAMPARQYRQQDMAQSLSLTIVNLFSSPVATHYSYVVNDSMGAEVHSYDGGYENAPAGGYQTAAVHATPPVGFAFPSMDSSTTFTIVHTVREGTSGDDHPDNDTIIFSQVFDNYYAYDDGTAENGYGITSTASRIYLASRFDLAVPDTLTAVEIYFNNTYGDATAAVQFYITVWQAGADGSPAQVLYRDAASRHPHTGGYSRYTLDHEVIVSGSIFVGFEQVGNTFINVGYDRSRNVADKLYYLTSGAWQRSILSGALMLRPFFGQRAALGIANYAAIEKLTPIVSPNPSSGRVSVSSVPVGSTFMLYDMRGQLMLSSADSTLDVSHLPQGVYMLVVKAPDGHTAVSKLAIVK